MLRKALALTLSATVLFACEADYTIWIPRSRTADPLFRFVKNGKGGYIDSSGEVIISASLPVWGNSSSEFHDGLLEIAVSNGRYVDRTGNVVVDPHLYRGWDFSEGLAVAMRKGEKLWGYIDTTGRFAISPRFETVPNGYVYSFSDGLAMIQVNGKYGYIDHAGEFLIKPEFLDATAFSDGFARVITEGPCVYFPDGACGTLNPRIIGGQATSACKFSYINKLGRTLGSLHFDSGRDFSEGLAPVRIGQLWGFIDKSGAMAILPQFDEAWPFASGLARIRKGDKFGYVDKFGSTSIPARYQSGEDFSDGLAVVSDDGPRFFYIDQNGNHAFPGEFEIASPFFKGLANVRFLPSDKRRKDGEFAYINANGKVVFHY